MTDRLRAYHALPYPLKRWVVGLHGLRLQRERYGPETGRLISEARVIENWDPVAISRWQEARIEEILERAGAAVPFYRESWGSPATQLGRNDLGSWPILRKEEVRSHPAGFVAEDAAPSEGHEIHTSGSTGTPITVRVGTQAIRRWYALFEARWCGWHGVGRDDRWAIVGGRLVTRPGRKRPPYWVWNRPMHQLYLSAYHLAPSTVADYVGAMRRHQVAYLLGYPSAMFELAREALERGVACPTLRVVISNAEPLLPEQRSVIGRAFGCPVRDTYGMAEMVAAAGECEHGTMHLWPEVGYVEVLDDRDRPVPAGEVGRLVCTGLLNDVMPLIRYEVGDRGSLAPSGERCPCGRSLPILKSVEGRLDDVVTTPDGRRVGRLDTVFKTDLPIRFAQIVQDAEDRLVVRVVPAPGFNGTAGKEIKRRLRDRVGHMQIDLQEVSDIPRGPSGKRRGVISRLSVEGGRSG